MGHFGEKNHQQTFFTVCVYSKMHPTGWRLKKQAIPNYSTPYGHDSATPAGREFSIPFWAVVW